MLNKYYIKFVHEKTTVIINLYSQFVIVRNTEISGEYPNKPGI